MIMIDDDGDGCWWIIMMMGDDGRWRIYPIIKGVFFPNLIWRYFLLEQKNYVQFHNIKFKMPESQLLIGLETRFKNWEKAQNVNMYSILKAYIWFYPLPPSLWFVCLWKYWQLWIAPCVTVIFWYQNMTQKLLDDKSKVVVRISLLWADFF